jgi:hypothetical protein
MADEQKRGKGRTKDKPTERRFVPTITGRAKLVAALGALGAMALGAGVYAQWIRTEPLAFSPWLLAAGAALVALATFVPDPGSMPLRVGPAGIAIERGGDQPDRLAWCDVERIAFEGDAVVVTGAGAMRVVAGLPHHEGAAAWIVAEGLERVAKRVEVTEEQRARLPKTSEVPGESLTFEPVQVAGRRCKASGKLISFEDDARLCPRCGQVYHREHVPERCVTCDAPTLDRQATV